MLAVVAVFASALVAPPSAFAHASLIGTTPTRGAVLDRSPAQVVLRFDESVSTVAGSVRVFDGDVRRVDSGDVSKPSSDEVAVGLPAALADGTYTVAWRVLSADSHPIRGAFVFSVGEPTGDASGVVDEVLDAEAGSEAVDAVAGGRPLRRPRADPAVRRRCGGAGLRRGCARGAGEVAVDRARGGRGCCLRSTRSRGSR